MEKYFELKEISEAEATKLYRLANNLEKRNGKKEVVSAIRKEANKLHANTHLDQLLSPFILWTYAFR